MTTDLAEACQGFLDRPIDLSLGIVPSADAAERLIVPMSVDRLLGR